MSKLLGTLFLAAFILWNFPSGSFANGGSSSMYISAKRLASEGRYGDAAAIIAEMLAKEKSAHLYSTLTEYRIAAGNIDGALNTLENAVKDFPQNAEFPFMAGQIYDFYKKDANKALEYYEKALKYSDDPKYMLAAAVCSEITQKNGRAIELLNELIKKDPENAIYYSYRGSIYYKIKKEKAAVRDLNKAVELNNDLTAKLMLAEIYVNKKENDKAIKLLEEISAENEALRTPIDSNIGKIYLSEHNYTKAVEIYRNIADKLYGANKARALQQLGMVLNEAGRYKESAETFEEITKFFPNDSQNYYIAGKTYEYLGDLDKAEEIYLKALKENPEYSQILKRLTVVYLLKDRPDDALKHIDLVDEVERDMDWFLLKSECYDLKKETKKAIAVLEDGLKENPTNAQMLYYSAALYEKDGNREKAITYIKDALKIEPENAGMQNFLGYLYADMGINLNDALILIKKALEKEPKNAAYLDSLGWVYFKMKDYKKAGKYLEEALKIMPDEKEMLEHMKALKNATKK